MEEQKVDAANLDISYQINRISQCQLTATVNEANGRWQCTRFELDGRLVQPTARFWTSMMSRIGIGSSTFKLFSHEEVFDRISKVLPDDTLRFCLENDPNGEAPSRLLAVSSPDNGCLRYLDAKDVILEGGGTDLTYQNGMLSSIHVPASGNRMLSIGPDEFKNRMFLQTPIDGFGRPNIYLGILRMVCTNLSVAMSKVCRTEISGGNEIAYTLRRALESFDSDDGFSALRSRIDKAQHSWASIREAFTLLNILTRLVELGLLRHEVLDQFHGLIGHIHQLYGVANPEAFSSKRQRALPVSCSVYDLMNFISETATHHITEPEARVKLHGAFGGLITDEFDLEGSLDQFGEFKDFFTKVEPNQLAV